jgi:hypothetical protein
MTTIDHQPRRTAEPVATLVDRAASASARLVRDWSALDDDARFECAQQLSRCLQEIRRQSGS